MCLLRPPPHLSSDGIVTWDQSEYVAIRDFPNGVDARTGTAVVFNFTINNCVYVKYFGHDNERAQWIKARDLGQLVGRFERTKFSNTI